MELIYIMKSWGKIQILLIRKWYRRPQAAECYIVFVFFGIKVGWTPSELITTNETYQMKAGALNVQILNKKPVNFLIHSNVLVIVCVLWLCTDSNLSGVGSILNFLRIYLVVSLNEASAYFFNYPWSSSVHCTLGENVYLECTHFLKKCTFKKGKSKVKSSLF